MIAHSIQFGNINLREKYGVIVEKVERPFFAKLRPRKVEIPNRSGAYDYGAKYRDELILPIKCGTKTLLSYAQVRELVYELSHKNRIMIWDEPDKYYIGRLYESGKIERIVATMRKFTLSFVCDPYAYGKTVQTEFGSNVYNTVYEGTETTPTRIEITNTGNTEVTGLQITIVERRSIY